MAVRMLSPVAITVLTLQSLSFSMISVVTGFSLFYMTRKPRKVRSFSTSSRFTF